MNNDSNHIYETVLIEKCDICKCFWYALNNSKISKNWAILCRMSTFTFPFIARECSGSINIWCYLRPENIFNNLRLELNKCKHENSTRSYQMPRLTKWCRFIWLYNSVLLSRLTFQKDVWIVLPIAICFESLILHLTLKFQWIRTWITEQRT